MDFVLYFREKRPINPIIWGFCPIFVSQTLVELVRKFSPLRGIFETYSSLSSYTLTYIFPPLRGHLWYPSLCMHLIMTSRSYLDQDEGIYRCCDGQYSGEYITKIRNMMSYNWRNMSYKFLEKCPIILWFLDGMSVCTLEILWDILKLANWESGSASFTWLESNQNHCEVQSYSERLDLTKMAFPGSHGLHLNQRLYLARVKYV